MFLLDNPGRTWNFKGETVKWESQRNRHELETHRIHESRKFTGAARKVVLSLWVMTPLESTALFTRSSESIHTYTL